MSNNKGSSEGIIPAGLLRKSESASTTLRTESAPGMEGKKLSEVKRSIEGTHAGRKEYEKIRTLAKKYNDHTFRDGPELTAEESAALAPFMGDENDYFVNVFLGAADGDRAPCVYWYGGEFYWNDGRWFRDGWFSFYRAVLK